MAVPSLPSDMAGGNVFTAARINAVYDLLEFFRDARPRLRITGSSRVIAEGSAYDNEFSDGSGGWADTPSTNVGGWTPGSGGAVGIIIPEDGDYWISYQVRCQINDANTYLQTQVTDNGVGTTLKDWSNHPNAGVNDVFVGTAGMRDFTAGDELGVEIEVTAAGGSTVAVTCHLHAYWLGS